jgi:hypothetical protein
MDETGTDGRHAFTVVAGAVATVEQWQRLEDGWKRRLSIAGVTAFHSKEFNARQGEFDGWTEFKCERFAQALNKIIARASYFDFAVAVDDAALNEIKREMGRTKGYKAESTYGAAFRIARLHICRTIAQQHPNARVHFVVEDGPWSGGAYTIYQEILRTRDAKRPAGFARMLAGFAAVPKGDMRSLEAADYLAGKAIRDLEHGNPSKRKRRHFIVADRDFLRDQYLAGMIEEKERRKDYYARGRKEVGDRDG